MRLCVLHSYTVTNFHIVFYLLLLKLKKLKKTVPVNIDEFFLTEPQLTQVTSIL